MHYKTLAVLLLCLPLSACRFEFGSQPPLPWAQVKKSVIVSALSERIRQANPYPSELGDPLQQRTDQEQLRRQISDLRQSALSRCIASQTPAGTSKPSTGAIQGLSSYEQIMIANGSSPTAAQRCSRVAEGDQLVSDLRVRLAGMEAVEEKRRQFDINIRKKIEQAADDAIENYARSQKYELVVGSDSSIVFNEKKVVLDITEAVIESIKSR
ncbi:hypothetical protein PSCICO_10110 [Pseudomonas cichorii]|uniref:Outer membrane protein n=1 Tax=Pseudomonas serbiensis TaxID=3064350 RepID=A0ABT9CKS6_9PSED|nr:MULTISPECIES: hypothetical protein [Pseudomonas]MDO7925352.1 hypothetical protein [Pseudomonas sp. KFB-138]GFM85612.1 hypothetical protein PSCICO_10110 [Pseudomonas cichorii]